MGRIIKLSTPWSHDFLKRTPGKKGIFGNYRFEIDNDCVECDYWVVWGRLREISKVKCPSENIIYVTDETHSERKFNSEFLNQFPTIVACRKDLSHSHIIHTHDLGIWHFDKSYDEVAALDVRYKPKLISIVSSSLANLPGHKKRFTFLNQMRGYLGDRVDYYGRGINPIVDKIQGLESYQYSVAIENSYIESYFTEKIFECFLTNTFPIYYGCPDLENYFDDRAFARIDIADHHNALMFIDEIISENGYEARVPYLREAKRLYLEKYFFFPAIIDIIEKDPVLKTTKKKTKNKLYPEHNFLASPLRRAYQRIKYFVK